MESSRNSYILKMFKALELLEIGKHQEPGGELTILEYGETVFYSLASTYRLLLNIIDT